MAIPEQVKMEKRLFNFELQCPLTPEESTNTKLNALPRELKSVFQMGSIVCNLTMGQLKLNYISTSNT